MFMFTRYLALPRWLMASLYFSYLPIQSPTFLTVIFLQPFPWLILSGEVVLLSVLVGNQTIRLWPTCFGFSALPWHSAHCLRELTVDNLVCFRSLIASRVVISFSQSEHNESFNGNHEKLCTQSGRVVCWVRDDDLLTCTDIMFASCCWQSLQIQLPICPWRL